MARQDFEPMMPKSMKILLLAVALLVSQAFAAKVKPTNQRLVIGTSQEFDSLHPLTKVMLASSYIYFLAGRSLVALDRQGKWQPLLAVKIPTLKNGLAKITTNNGRKKVQVTWEIKKDARWGDGTPVTGHDAKLSWRVAMSPNVAVSYNKDYRAIENIVVDAKNPKRFTIYYKKATWRFNRMSSFYLIPNHLEGPIFEKYGNKPGAYITNSLYTTNPTHPGLYNGPYVISEVKLGSHITVKPNKYFYGIKPKIKEITVRLIPNTGTLEANLRAGNIDMISNIGLSLDQALSFEKKVKKERLSYQVNFKRALVYEHIDLYLHNPILKDVRVRKALLHAIDRKKLTSSLFEGRQAPAIHHITPGDPWYTENPKYVVQYKASKRMARKLLEEAGWKVGKDKFRYKDGKKLSLQLMTTAGNKSRETVQVYLQNQWRKVGVEVTIKNEPPRVYFGQTLRRGGFGAMAMYAWGSLPEQDVMTIVHSKQIPSEKNAWAGQNFTRWVNKEVDKIVEEMEVTFDPKRRKELAHKFLYHHTNELPILPLYYRSDISVTPKNMTGYALTGHSFPTTLWAEYWDLK